MWSRAVDTADVDKCAVIRKSHNGTFHRVADVERSQISAIFLLFSSARYAL